MSKQEFQATTAEDWTRSDQYHNSFLHTKDDVLDAALENSAVNGLPEIAVSAAQGKFLNLLVSSIGAKKILEVGTLGGYSTIWLARALPGDGELITLELDENMQGYFSSLFPPASHNIERAGLASNKGNLSYFIEAKRLVRKAIVDNVVRYGRVADPEYSDTNVEGVRALLKAVKGDMEVDATTIGTVGDRDTMAS
ncbi:O-methyltransferase-domain-containing protein, partial [Mycena sp. CBHHK59/15]